MQVTGSNSSQHILSIRFSADGFYFAILNPKAKEKSDSYTYYIYKVDESLSLTANLKQAINQLDWLSYTYQSVHIVIATRRFTLIPLDFFEDEQKETIFYHNFHPIDNEVVEYNILQKSNMVLLFGIDKALLSLLYEQFPEAQVQVQATPLIEYLATQNRQAKNRQMLCFVTNDSIIITAMEHRNLIFGNSFACNCTDDRLYYIMYCWKQLGMDQLHDELLLADNASDSSTLQKELSRFIQHVTVLQSTYLDLESFIS
ncbi:MAG: DUF3822 family protein [Bacteroidaceae bacterium]|nr:DUF3822 family protein [Bacteroidaceae bacterium]